jgi:hypothetical protein
MNYNRLYETELEREVRKAKRGCDITIIVCYIAIAANIAMIAWRIIAAVNRCR